MKEDTRRLLREKIRKVGAYVNQIHDSEKAFYKECEEKMPFEQVKRYNKVNQLLSGIHTKLSKNEVKKTEGD